MRAVVVDDSDVLREALAAVAAAAGLEVIGSASSGEEALRLQEALRPDVVLLDVRLPGMDGHAVAARIRSAFPGTRVVLVSATAGSGGNVVPKARLSPQRLLELLEVAPPQA